MREFEYRRAQWTTERPKRNDLKIQLIQLDSVGGSVGDSPEDSIEGFC